MSATDRSDGTSVQQDEILLAVQNAMKLGASLIVTWGISLAIRLLLPRYLGPAGFGAYNFAETFTAAWFVFLSLGIETFIQKEAPADPNIVNRIGGGMMVLRLALGALVAVAAQHTLWFTGRHGDTMILVAFFSLGQLAVYDANFIGTALQARGKVGRLAIVNIIAKTVWGGWLFACMFLHSPIWILALAFALSEIVRAVAIHHTGRQVLDFHLIFDFRAALAAIKAALPYYLNVVVLVLSSNLVVTMLSFVIGNDAEVGFFSAAQTLAGIALLLTPIVYGVVAPMLNRTIAKSRDEFFALLGRTTFAMIQITLPVTLVLFLGADLWVRLAFGAKFQPSAYSLRTLAPTFTLTYVSIVLSLAAIALGRGWIVIRISLCGIITSVLVTVSVTPIIAHLLGTGGAGVGAALGVMSMEVVTVVLSVWVIGRKVWTAKLGRSVVVAMLAALVAVIVDTVAKPLWPAVRLSLDVAVYLTIIMITRTVVVRDVFALVTTVKDRQPR